MKIAVIPARGGSKRVPRKNIRPFAGKPIIAYSIAAARSADMFDRIIVSTDDPEIAAVAREYGAETPFERPRELADDFAGTNAVVKHAIQWLQDSGDTIECACCIYATAPLLRPEYLRRGLDELLRSGKSFAFSVTKYPFAVQRALRINKQGAVEPFYPDYNESRSQDLEPAYHDAGQFYWGRSEAFLNDDVLYSAVSVPVVLPNYLVQDIDTLEDWELAELMFKVQELRREGDVHGKA